MDLDPIRGLALAASSEGFAFLQRLVQDLERDVVRLNQPDEFFLCVETEGQIIGIGGVTPDPYLDDNIRAGRVRHIYVRADWRRLGVATRLLREIERRAKETYTTLRLRTDTAAGALFYESRGYRRVDSSNATHERHQPFP